MTPKIDNVLLQSSPLLFFSVQNSWLSTGTPTELPLLFFPSMLKVKCKFNINLLYCRLFNILLNFYHPCICLHATEMVFVNSFSSPLSIGKCINQVSHILVLFQVVKKDLKCRASMPTQRWCPHFND